MSLVQLFKFSWLSDNKLFYFCLRLKILFHECFAGLMLISDVISLVLFSLLYQISRFIRSITSTHAAVSYSSEYAPSTSSFRLFWIFPANHKHFVRSKLAATEVAFVRKSHGQLTAADNNKHITLPTLLCRFNHIKICHPVSVLWLLRSQKTLAASKWANSSSCPFRLLVYHRNSCYEIHGN
jgi:hypothetical protein